MSHKEKMGWIIATCAVLDIAAGVLFAHYERLSIFHGISWAIGVATTSGSRYSPVNNTGDLLQDIAQLTIIPLFGAAFSYFISGVTTDKVQSQLDDHHASFRTLVKSLGGSDAKPAG